MGIPARLLVHTCTYTAPAGGYDRDGEPIPGEPVTLDKVRLEPVNAIGNSTEGVTANDRLTLYYDPLYSQPAITPAPGAVVTWNGEDYTIRSVTPCYTCGGDEVHHFEAALV
jgi:hypothetical protein